MMLGEPFKVLDVQVSWQRIAFGSGRPRHEARLTTLLVSADQSQPASSDYVVVPYMYSFGSADFLHAPIRKCQSGHLIEAVSVCLVFVPPPHAAWQPTSTPALPLHAALN